MKAFIRPYVGVVIPANDSRVMDGVYGRTFQCIDASDAFAMSYDDGSKFPMQVGLGFDLQDETYTKFEFFNDSDDDITITFYAGNFKVFDSRAFSVTQRRALVQQSVTNATNPFVYNWYDASAPAGYPEAFPLTLPLLKPYRRCWAFYAASTFPALGDATMEFYSGSTLVLTLPIFNKVAADGNTQFGMGMSDLADGANRAARANSIVYKNGSGNTYHIHPIDLYVFADSVKLNRSGGVAGTIRAFLGVLSTEESLA